MGAREVREPPGRIKDLQAAIRLIDGQRGLDVDPQFLLASHLGVRLHRDDEGRVGAKGLPQGPEGFG